MLTDCPNRKFIEALNSWKLGTSKSLATSGLISVKRETYVFRRSLASRSEMQACLSWRVSSSAVGEAVTSVNGSRAIERREPNLTIFMENY